MGLHLRGSDNAKKPQERKAIHRWGFVSAFRNVCRKLGLDVTRHDIRRTTGSRILRGTGNLKAASVHLGHADPQITSKHYVHIKGDDMVETLNRASEATERRREQLREILRDHEATDEG